MSTNKDVMRHILDAAQSITYYNMGDAKESLRDAIELIDAMDNDIEL